MALKKTTAELKLVETALPQKVTEKAGQVILGDDGKLFYDNTVKGRTRINPDSLKLVDASTLTVNKVVAPLTSLSYTGSSSKRLRLETHYNEDGWLEITTPEVISIDSVYYAYVPRTTGAADRFWKMLEADNPFIGKTTTVTANGVSCDAFSIRLIYNGDGTPSDAQQLSGKVVRYSAPSELSDSYYNLLLTVTDYDSSAADIQSIFEYGYTFDTLILNVRLLNTNGAYVTWTGIDLQAIHGYQESATSPITFAAPLQIRNPETGEIESIQTQEGGYIKFLGFNTVAKAIEIFDNGNDGIIQSTETLNYGFVYAQLAFEPTWISGGELSADTFLMALPLPHKMIDNITCIYFSVSDLGSESLTGIVSRIISDCGNFCIVEITWDDTKDFELPVDAKDCGIKGIEVEYTIPVQSGQAMWCHSNEYGVRFVEVITDPVILDEVDEVADQPVRSSGIAKYIRDNVAGVYKFKGSITVETANRINIEFEEHEVAAGYVYNVINDGSIIGQTKSMSTTAVSCTSNTVTLECLISADSHIDCDTCREAIIDCSLTGFSGKIISIESLPDIITEGNSHLMHITVEIPQDVLDSGITGDELLVHIQFVTLVYSTCTVKSGDNIVWNGIQWDKLAGTIDLSGYATKAEVTNIRADLTSVLRYCGTVECGDSVEYRINSLRIGDVYNVYHKHAGGYGTLNMSNNDVELIVNANGTATFAGADIETATGKRRDSANYLKMDVGATPAVDGNSLDYHWILVPDTNKFEGYIVYNYDDTTKIPEAGTYIVTEISLYVEEEDNGVNVVWDGVGFDKLGHTVDLSKYVAVRDIESTVNAKSDNPVSGKAVDAAIKSAVSSVYRYSGTLEILESLPNRCAIGNVYNVYFTGTIQGTTTEYTNFELDTEIEGSFSVRLPISGLKPGDELEISEIKLRGPSEEYQMLSAYCSNEGYLDITWIVEEDQSAPSNADSNIIQITSKSIDVKRGDNIVKTALGWDKLAATIDLSSYATVDQLNTVKADISHVFKYKGSVFVYDSYDMLNLPEVGDVYNTAYPDDAGPFQLDVVPAVGATFTIRDEYDDWWVFSGNDAFYKSFAVGVGHDHMGAVSDQIELYYDCEDTSTGSNIRFRVEDLYNRIVSIDWNYTDVDASALVDGATFELGLIITKFKSLKTGDNIVWNGTYMEPLASHVDLTPYQLKSGITNKVASGNKNPVQSGAVYDAIKAAVSSVYKPIGSYTVELLNRYRTDYKEFTNIFAEGNVVNIANDGVLLQPNVSEIASAVDLQLISVEANSDDPSLFDYVFETSSNGYYASFKAYAQRVYVDGIAIDAFEVNSDYDLVVTGDLSSIAKDVGDAFSVTWGLTDFEVIAGDNVVWTPEGWDKLAGTVDLTGYQPKLEFAAEISSENASKAVTAGPVKSYVDSEISKFLESSGSILNLVGSGQATEVGSYTFAEATTVEADTVACTITFETPSYKLMIPAIQAPVGTMLSINDEINVYIMDSYGHVTPDTVFTFEVLPDGSLTQMAISATESTNMPHIIGKLSEARINSVSIKSDRAVTFDANTVVKIYGWPMVQDSNTATSINAMLKEIYDTQEAFKAQTSIPDSNNAVKSYTSVADLPTAANSGSVAAVTSDSDKSARGMYMFISGKWQRLAFASESLVDGDTVEVTIE